MEPNTTNKNPVVVVIIVLAVLAVILALIFANRDRTATTRVNDDSSMQGTRDLGGEIDGAMDFTVESDLNSMDREFQN